MGVVEGEIVLDWRNRGWIDLFQFASRRRWRGFFDRLIWFVITGLLSSCLSPTLMTAPSTDLKTYTDMEATNNQEKLRTETYTKRDKKKDKTGNVEKPAAATKPGDRFYPCGICVGFQPSLKMPQQLLAPKVLNISAPLLITRQHLYHHLSYSHHNHRREQRSLEGRSQSLLITSRLLYLPHNLRTYLQIPA